MKKIIILLTIATIFFSIPIKIQAYNFTQQLSPGSSGSDVRMLQQFLKEKEYYNYPTITGYYGAHTTQAVQMFQKIQGIVSAGLPTVSGYGRVGPRTLNALNTFNNSQKENNTLPNEQKVFNRDLQIGSTGEDVRSLQQFLNTNGFIVAETGAGSKGKETTTFGIYTKLALIRYQTAVGVEVTGTLDEQTRTKILSINTITPPSTSIATTVIKRGGRSSGTTISTDTTAPLISNISSNTPSQNSTTITWSTNELSDSQVEYGTTTSYGSLTTISDTTTTSHSVVLTGLVANTTYHYRVISKDINNNIATSTDYTFVTSSAMPAGAIGLWYIDQYQNTDRPVIANAVTENIPSTNLFAAPRKMFNSDWWSINGATVNDSNELSPDNTSSASTLEGAGNWWLRQSSSSLIPAGTYTMAISVKSNNGSNQQFSFYTANTLDRSPAYIANNSWQRFTYTFTLENPESIGRIGISSVDESTGASLQIVDFGLYRGTTDPGQEVYAGHLYLGSDAFDTTPTYANGELNLSTGGYGLIQFNESKTLETMTVQALISRTSGGSSYSSILSKVGGYSNFSAMTERSGAPSSYYDNSSNSVIPEQNSGLWSTTEKGYHVITLRYNGLTFDYWIDDIRILSNTASYNAITLSDIFLNITNTPSLYAPNKYAGAIALWDRGLTDEEIRTAVAYQKERALMSSINSQNAERILVAEGDSITGGFSFSYPYKFGANANPSVYGVNYATSGSTISTMESRASTIDSIIPDNTSGRDFILSVFIGANGLPTDGSEQNWLDELANYLDDRRTAGWKIALCTILPNTNASFNSIRTEVNTVMRTWVGTHADAICDFGGDSIMGNDATATDTTYYIDGQHPTSTGQDILETIYRTTINSL